ncbi:MAG: hypothetical protein GY909_09110 [Oligoflexia bacterium]|nr:hypothetical protein [Oligoflexia bacterium]
MNIVLVTSQITYVPKNYLGVLENLFAHLNKDLVKVKAFITLKNLDQSVLKSTLGLYALGASKTANSLVKNIVELPKRSREKFCEERKIRTLSFSTMNDPEVVSLIKDLNIDLIINMRTRCIYKKDILEAPRLGCVNIHHGILPKYRGTLCDLYALSENRPAGFTIHMMNKKIDAGKIIKAVEVDSGTEKNYAQYLSKAADIEGIELAKILNQWAQSKKIPSEIKNECDSPVFTKNPKRNQIKQFKKQGLIL